MKIAITGANSSVGKVLLAHLATTGDISTIAGVRSQKLFATLPESPRITPCLIRYDDSASLSRLVTDADCVVHLAGILLEGRTSTYQAANIDTTQAVVDACQHAHVNHIVLVSVLGADRHSPNRYFNSKGRAEQVIHNSGISGTIIRTPILLGPDTAGARSLVALASRSSVKVLGGGQYSMCPLDVDDLSRAILACARLRSEGVAVHELAGPQATTYRGLISELGRLMGHEVSIGSIPIWAGRLGAAIMNRITGRGMTPTVIDVITANEVVPHNGASDLGVTLTPLSTTLDKLLNDRTQPHDRV